MKIKLIFLVLLTTGYSSAQQDWTDTAKSDLKALSVLFHATKQEYDIEKEKLIAISNTLSEDPKDQYDKTLNLKTKLDSVYNKRTTFIDFYLAKNVVKDSLILYFPEKIGYTVQGQTKKNDDSLQSKTTYFLFGDGNLIKEADLLQNEALNKVFSKVINEKSECNLGKFEIPAIGQLISVYKGTNRPGQKFNDLSFEEVNVTLQEGSMEDIRVILIDKVNNLKYYFENRLAASLLRNTMNGQTYCLACSFITSIDKDKSYDAIKYPSDCHIILKDVLQYQPNPGNNYVPDDQNLIFPVPGQKNQEPNTRGIYELVQNTSLQNTVELRTYTDFLGLFNDSPNGVVQIEGKAEFFINPFRIVGSGPLKNFYFFKKIVPYVNFSKIDDVDRGITLNEPVIIGSNTINTIKNSLQILEKSYLELGVNLNILSVKFMKEMPFKTNLYFPLRYNITSLSNDKTDNRNLKMVSYGLGLNLEFKKFSNFGFNYSAEFSDYRPINRSETIINPDSFWVFRNEAELLYFAGDSKNQSIFVRFRTFYNASDDKDSFFQFQFGYRFSIGAGRVKS